ncbi:MAG: 2-oxoglutarate synthase [Candidatus Thiodiazotropha lotti]|nr:2-oxoglutarate synthase [Candidatus Thiodiazotropha lotti]MCG7999480.1 2-oxoglutarate synthase [Candidatus Thiodiazotropha lotti]MCW4182309.1 2-oxoglutarate synthase [Candidatus Thiodiazotropha weberae]MCW4191248.1 2-oxoglutarate synthase [Candidatus Thiodiazotropha weberae]
MTNISRADDAFFGSGYNDRINIRLSGFRALTSTEIEVDSEQGVIGEELSFEDDLDLSERETLPLLDITYRFSPHHMMDFSYVELSRNGSTTFGREGVTTDDILWSVGTRLESRFDSEVYRLAYGYSFFNDGKKEWGLLLGLHVTRFDLELSGRGSLVAVDQASGNEVEIEGEGERTYDSGFTVPLPVIGLHGSYAFTPNLYFRGWGQIFALEYDDYEGRLLNFAGMLEYALNEHFGFGLGYAYYSYDLDADGDRLNGSFDYDFRGPTLFFSASF